MPTMARGLDHVAHAVRDLDAAGEFYRRLGFTVGARNRHSWGTHNRLVQLPGFFVELLTMAEPEKLGDDGFSVLFGGFAKRFLERHEGLAVLLLESRDAAADAATFEAASIAASKVLRFERQGSRPDGTPIQVAFSLAFARDMHAPDAGFAVCQQHYPENFWNAAFQDHANMATGVAGVVLVADKPAEHEAFLSAFAGQPKPLATPDAKTFQTPRGEIQTMTPLAFESHFGVAAPDVSRGARIAAVRFAVRDMATAAAAWKNAGLTAKQHGGRFVFGPEAAIGAVIAFELAG